MNRLYDRWAPRLIAALVLAAPLFFTSATHDTYDLPKLTLVYFVDLLLAALWLWPAAGRRDVVVRRTALDAPLLVFLGAGFLSACRSLDPSLSFFGSYQIYVFGWCPMLAFCLLYFFTVQAAGPSLAQSVRWAALLSAAVVGIYALLQYGGFELFSDIPGAKGGRVWASLGNPIYLGALCMMAIVLAFEEWNAAGAFCGLLALAGLVLSLSRSAWVGTFAAFAAVAFLKRRRIRQWGVPAALAVLIVGFAVAFVPGVRERARVLFSSQESSNAARLEGWKGGLRVWRNYPILGSGPDTFFQAFRPYRTEAYQRAAGMGVTQADAHNDFIQLAATQGTLGWAIYVWILIIFLRKSRTLSADSKGIWGAAVLALALQNQFNFSSVATSAWAAVFAGLLFEPAKESDVLLRGFAGSPALRFASVVLLLSGLWAISIPVRADWQYKEGLAWAQGNQPFIALDHFREAVRLNGRVEIYETALANTARSTGHLDDAWAVSEDLVRRHPRNPDVWNNRGVGAMWMVQMAGADKWDAAKASFEKAISLDPIFVEAWANLAKWQHLRGNLDEEKKLWKKVLELDPHHPMAKQVLGVP